MKLALVLIIPLILVMLLSLMPLAKRSERMTVEQHEALIISERIYLLMNLPISYALIAYFAYCFWISGLNHPSFWFLPLVIINWAYDFLLDRWGYRLPLLGDMLGPALEERRKLLSIKFDKPGKPLVLEKI